LRSFPRSSAFQPFNRTFGVGGTWRFAAAPSFAAMVHQLLYFPVGFMAIRLMLARHVSSLFFVPSCPLLNVLLCRCRSRAPSRFARAPVARPSRPMPASFVFLVFSARLSAVSFSMSFLPLPSSLGRPRPARRLPPPRRPARPTFCCLLVRAIIVHFSFFIFPAILLAQFARAARRRHLAQSPRRPA
jgi:hypothetical protein